MTDPGAEKLWRFEAGHELKQVETRLKETRTAHSRHSTTVSYFMRLGDEPRLDSYELHAIYTGQYLPSGDAEVDKSHVRSSYSLFRSPEGSRWIAESAGEEISEEDFYSMVLYERPDRMLSLQEISFETPLGRYLIELNLESGLLVLVGLEGTDQIPSLLADIVHPEELRRSSYLSELFEHDGGLLES